MKFSFQCNRKLEHRSVTSTNFIKPVKSFNMIILQIEHPVPDYNAWKKVFDSDPVGRKQSGVKSHKIFRQSDNANNIIVDLEFETIEDAINLQTKLKNYGTRLKEQS